MLSFGNPHLDGDTQKIGLAMAAQRGSKLVNMLDLDCEWLQTMIDEFS